MSKVDYSKLDPGVVPLVKYFNKNGLKTVMSCEGHDDHGSSMFWIEFDPKVTQKDLIKFQKKHTREYFGFCANGFFCKRFFLDMPDGSSDAQTISGYYYVAHDKDKAAQDLLLWNLHDLIGVEEGTEHFYREGGFACSQ